MRAVSAKTQRIWESGRYIGVDKPMVRATVQRLTVLQTTVKSQLFTSIAHGQAAVPVELPNLRSVRWNRRTDGGVATMTMTLFNTAPVPLGETPEADLDRPGYYTFQRGATNLSTLWGHKRNDWQNRLVPDRLIRTYEGYGFNPEVPAELDENLYLSGIWLVDDVVYDTEGIITIEARDVGRALLEQVIMPPVIPSTYYPLRFEKQVTKKGPPVTVAATWKSPTYDVSSNTVWYTDNPIAGHRPSDAFTTNVNTYWLSVGNISPGVTWAYEWIQGKFAATDISAIRLYPWAGPYTVYVSVYAGGKWLGTKTVPYRRGSQPDNGAAIPYLYTFTVAREKKTEYHLPAEVKGATKLRLTFHNLSNSTIGPYHYRAGVRSLEITAGSTTVPGPTVVTPATTPPGITDYVDIVKILLAYAGWYWPRDKARAVQTLSNGASVYVQAATNDPVIGYGRVWADIQASGTAPKAPLGIDVWDKKPIMDAINYVRDILGFIFYVDETGAVVFRAPNIWTIGNWVGAGATTAGRTTNCLTISDDKVLMSLSARLSSRSIREKVFIGSPSYGVGAVSDGHNPFPSGLRRVGGWTDTKFSTVNECQVMADLITLRQLFTYRTDTVKIPGNPAIQIDDQVRLRERITEEGHLHYVAGISMNWSAETGVYTYDLDTHWLGDSPYDIWSFNPAKLSKDTQTYVNAMLRK